MLGSRNAVAEIDPIIQKITKEEIMFKDLLDKVFGLKQAKSVKTEIMTVLLLS